jgi:hypothetical protein
VQKWNFSNKQTNKQKKKQNKTQKKERKKKEKNPTNKQNKTKTPSGVTGNFERVNRYTVLLCAKKKNRFIVK